MSRFLGIAVAAALASASFGAQAKDDAVKDLRQQAKATYEMDKQGCKGLDRENRKRCEFQARAKYDQEIAQIREDKKAYEAEDKAKRAEKRDAEKRRTAHSGNESKWEANRGASGRALERPVSNLDGAPVSGNSPYTGDPKVDQPPR